jgi:hypothetical protein
MSAQPAAGRDYSNLIASSSLRLLPFPRPRRPHGPRSPRSKRAPSKFSLPCRLGDLAFKALVNDQSQRQVLRPAAVSNSHSSDKLQCECAQALIVVASEASPLPRRQPNRSLLLFVQRAFPLFPPSLRLRRRSLSHTSECAISHKRTVCKSTAKRRPNGHDASVRDHATRDTTMEI